jgi:hypothetical protein
MEAATRRWYVGSVFEGFLLTFLVQLENLPTVVEAHKTFDKKIYLKSADIGQVLTVFSSASEREIAIKKLVKSSTGEKVLRSGLTPPTHDIVSSRFERTRKKDTYPPQRVKLVLDDITAPRVTLASLQTNQAPPGAPGAAPGGTNKSGKMNKNMKPRKSLPGNAAQDAQSLIEVCQIVQEEVVEFEDWMATTDQPNGVKFVFKGKDCEWVDNPAYQIVMEHPDVLYSTDDFFDDSLYGDADNKRADTKTADGRQGAQVLKISSTASSSGNSSSISGASNYRESKNINRANQLAAPNRASATNSIPASDVSAPEVNVSKSLMTVDNDDEVTLTTDIDVLNNGAQDDVPASSDSAEVDNSNLFEAEVDEAEAGNEEDELTGQSEVEMESPTKDIGDKDMIIDASASDVSDLETEAIGDTSKRVKFSEQKREETLAALLEFSDGDEDSDDGDGDGDGDADFEERGTVSATAVGEDVDSVVDVDESVSNHNSEPDIGDGVTEVEGAVSAQGGSADADADLMEVVDPSENENSNVSSSSNNNDAKLVGGNDVDADNDDDDLEAELANIDDVDDWLNA